MDLVCMCVDLVCRYLTQSLPLLFVAAMAVVLGAVRCLQQVQARVFRVVPFGMMDNLTVANTCFGILLSGLFMLYFGKCVCSECAVSVQWVGHQLHFGGNC